jgi:hypothetical protein
MGRLRTKTVKKLASLSALGAGALALAPDSAEASVIAYNGAPITLTFTSSADPLNPSPSVSWFAGLNGSLPLPAPAILAFGLYSCHCGHAKAGALGYSLAFATQLLGTISGGGYSFVGLFNSGSAMPGRGWSGFYPIASFFPYYSSALQSSILLSGGNGQFAHKFALFSFNNGTGGTDFGWAELSLTAFNNFDGTVTETLTIENYAYDDSGALLPAGEVPEPGTMGSMALGALALGAVGLRRWRAARQKTS